MKRRRSGSMGKYMQIGIYRVVEWVGIAALVVWVVFSAYSAFSFS